MVIWKADLTNDEVFFENTILETIKNPDNVTPWLLLLSYCETNNCDIKSVSLWDYEKKIRVLSPLKLSSIKPDKVDYRIKAVSTGLGKTEMVYYNGIVITKGSINFGVWYNSNRGEVITTLE